MDKMERDVIQALSEPAKRLFYSLDHNSQKRMLKQAKELATLKTKKEKQKKKVVGKDIQKKEKRKRINKETVYGRTNTYNCSSRLLDDAEKGGVGLKAAYVSSMHFLLIGQSEITETSQNDSTEFSRMASREGSSVFRTTRRITNFVRRNSRSSIAKKHAKKNARKVTRKSAQTAAKGAEQATKTVGTAIKSMVSAIATNPIVWIVLLVILVLTMIVGVIAMIVGGGGAANITDSSTYQAQVSEKTEGYRDLVTQYCEIYEIDEYVDLCLAMIEQESGGNPPDVMQTEQSYYNVNPPIDTAEESINCGTHELADCLTAVKCKGAGDISAIKLALQGYNFGNGYIAWALKNYKGYTKESAKIFSKKMCTELGLSAYGDTDYVNHVLRYYIENPETNVSNGDADALLKELKENNTASDEVWKMIEKGASLIGIVSYSMEKRQGDGRDNPEFLDCSSFTAWAFHKSGITSVPYSSTTGTFIASSKFVDVDATRLQPGDIGLKNRSMAGGGGNHVGIYCGKLKNGTKVWMHCTSESSSSLTRNTSGAMFGNYTNFTYFRRLKKWKT